MEAYQMCQRMAKLVMAEILGKGPHKRQHCVRKSKLDTYFVKK